MNGINDVCLILIAAKTKRTKQEFDLIEPCNISSDAKCGAPPAQRSRLSRANLDILLQQ